MQAVAAQFSGCAAKFCCFLQREDFKTRCVIHLFSKPALRQTRRVCLRARYSSVVVRREVEIPRMYCARSNAAGSEQFQFF